jgi:hypothetical protein
MPHSNCWDLSGSYTHRMWAYGRGPKDPSNCLPCTARNQPEAATWVQEDSFGIGYAVRIVEKEVKFPPSQSPCTVRIQPAAVNPDRSYQ